MKYLLFAAIAVAIYVFLVRKPADPVPSGAGSPPPAAVQTTSASPQKPPATSAAAATPAPSNFLKRPLDRTHEALEKVGKRNGNGEF